MSLDAYLADLRRKLSAQFDGLYSGLTDLKQRGFPVDVIRPEGGGGQELPLIAVASSSCSV